MKIRIFTFGCKVNQYDSQMFIELFSKQGYEISSDDYDVALVNTCCVTKKAEKEARMLIRKLSRRAKEVWVTGCLAEKVNMSNEFHGAKILSRDSLYKKAHELGIHTIEKFQGHTRVFVKIVDGCENFCNYCIVPFVRGRVRSRRISEIIQEVKVLVENSYKEIVLTGIDLGSFGKDTGETLIDLIGHLNQVKKLARFRLSSIEMFHLSDTLIKELLLSDKFCPSFHIPLQSGSDRILSSMGRSYSFSGYFNIIKKLRESFVKDITFTTDIMIGFPGETETDFEKTIEAIFRCEFLKVHVFPFSLHSETKAALLLERVPAQVVKERLQKAISVAEEVSMGVKKKFLRKRCNVLVEEKLDNFWFGYSENYIPVVISSTQHLAGKMVTICPAEIKKIGNTTYLFATNCADLLL
ncbi:MAG: MiaB/RimO family radical SAM methylthiotransferase [Candidatus Omnitrophica bacterium]|nr:MiaB/RimO family radical SAM methylthiotransferase [Candidatus Omnitrophota bacterium]MCM8824764.1 MiaB/RimO family radical SAM methylthiotransferase [Candidatus Omnitrophota bacterium]